MTILDHTAAAPRTLPVMRGDGRLVDVRRLGVRTLGGAVAVRLAVAARLAEAARLMPVQAVAATEDGLAVDVVLGVGDHADPSRDGRALALAMRDVGLHPDPACPKRWHLAV
jgi:hypothetical protein